MLIASNHALAQRNKHQLEREKEENLKRIAETNKILEETKSKKEATIGQLSALKQQINARNSVIKSLSTELEYIDTDIAENEAIIVSMETDIQNLREEYANMIYMAYKSNSLYDNLVFLFSSKTFNQLYNRIQYFKQYSEARKSQVMLISKSSKYLNQQRQVLNEKRMEKLKLLDSKTSETQSLTELKNQQDLLVSDLSKKEKELKNELEESKKSVKKLEKLITDLIKAEREKAMHELTVSEGNKSNKNKKSNSNEKNSETKVSLTPEVSEMSHSFAGNNGKLPWPVVHGNISHHFGKQAHPVLKGVYVENLGVDILTLKNETVRSVFKGKVITVASVPGMNNVVMIQHGEYFTVYAKLKSVMVETGQTVQAKDAIGEVHTDKNDVSELQFQIWKNNEKLDPEHWLNKK
jgi:septal ring factor EnvC (AmiA/AmiB activator)